MSDIQDFDILDRIALEDAIRKLSPMQQEIMLMYIWQDLPLDYIGKTLGPKYRGKRLAGSTIRYYVNKILEELRVLLDIENL